MPTRFNNIDTLIAIPVYNESRYVDDILTAVSKYSHNILAVDDGSNDDTAKLLGKYKSIKVIAHKTNQGYGQSLLDAFEFAQVEGYHWIITMDCDHQHQPSWIPQFFEEIKKDDTDIISGSRYLDTAGQGEIKPPVERVAINREITILLNRILELELTDSFCGFKAYRVESLKKLKLTERGYGLPLQLWIQAAAAKLRIREIAVPLIYHDPKRNFAGLLEIPKYRLHYYMDVIDKELTEYGYQNTKKLICP
jgi:dolichol-phosphate mannosyltransferase